MRRTRTITLVLAFVLISTVGVSAVGAKSAPSSTSNGPPETMRVAGAQVEHHKTSFGITRAELIRGVSKSDNDWHLSVIVEGHLYEQLAKTSGGVPDALVSGRFDAEIHNYPNGKVLQVPETTVRTASDGSFKFVRSLTGGATLPRSTEFTNFHYELHFSGEPVGQAYADACLEKGVGTISEPVNIGGPPRK